MCRSTGTAMRRKTMRRNIDFFETDADEEYGLGRCFARLTVRSNACHAMLGRYGEGSRVKGIPHEASINRRLRLRRYPL